MDVFDLAAKLTLDTSGYDKSLAGAEQSASGFGSKLKSGLGTAAKVGGAAVMAVGTAVVATGTALVKSTAEVAEYGDNIDKMSQKMGISATAYQEWDAVMQHSGTSMESLKTSMKTMASAAEKGNEAFQALGISEEEVASLSQEDLFSRVISGLQGMEEGTERTYLASQLLGRGATELGALLNTSAEDTQAMKDRVHELGGVMSDEAVKAAAAYQDTLQDMQTGFDGLKRNLISDFLPGITQVMSGITDLTTGDFDLGGEKINEGIDNVISGITEKLPAFLDAGFAIISALGDAVVENLPKLVETFLGAVEKVLEKLGDPSLIAKVGQSLVGIVTSLGKKLPDIIKSLGPVIINTTTVLLKEVLPALVSAILGMLPDLLQTVLDLVVQLTQFILSDGLPMIISMLPQVILGIVNFVLEAIPQIIDAAIQIVLALVEAIPQIITALVSAIPQIIVGLIVAILSNIPKLIEAGIKLFLGLIMALPQIIIELVKAIPQIIVGLVQAFKDAWPEIKQAGIDLFNSAVKGLADAQNLASKIKSAVSDIWEKLKEKLSGLVDKMKDIGKNILQGLIDGMKGMISKVGDTVKNIGDKISGGFKKLFGISSPSKLFAEYGEYLDEGLAIGINRGTDQVEDAMDSLNAAAMPDVKPQANLGLYGESESGYNGIVESFISALQSIGPLAIVQVEGNKDRIVDVTVQANREWQRMTGNGLYA